MAQQTKIIDLYQDYLQRSGLTEANLPPVQNQEMKRAFMAGAAEILTRLRNEITDLPEEEGIEMLEGLWQELLKFWISEAEREVEK